MSVEYLTNFKYVINFEYVAIFIFLIMIIYMFIEKLIHLKRSRLFTVVIGLAAIGTTFSILRSNIINKFIEDPSIGQMYLDLANIFNNTYYLFLFISTFAFSMYVVAISCSIPYVHRNIFRMLLYYVPAFVITGMIIANYFVPYMFEYAYDGRLMHKFSMTFMMIIIGMVLAYLLLTVFLTIRYRKLFEKKQIAILVTVFPIVFIGIVAEILAPEYLVLTFMQSIAIIIIQTVMEAYEDIIDEDTKLYNTAEFIKRIKRAYMTKDDKKVILMKMVNYGKLIKSYDNLEVRKYISRITDLLNIKRKEKNFKDQLFSLNNGYYVSVIDKNRYKNDGSDSLFETIKKCEYCSDFVPEMERCVIDIKTDFENAEELLNFVNNYRKSISFGKIITIYSDVKNDKNLNIVNHLEQIIDTGLAENEFVVYYQPIYSIKSKKFKTAEALVRLNSKKYGFISPGVFIPYAENTGRIEEIDSFVMEEVFKFVSSSVFSVLGLDYIEINLSMAECINPMLVTRVKDLMEKYNVDPSNINLEITESFDTSEQEIINNNLNKLIEMGFRFSLDDYGTGYSNINRFSNLPISIVKIDKSLVDESENNDIKKILDYSFNIVKDLHKQTVVEGVETIEQLERFKDYGATYIQGFYFSKPLDYESYIEFVRSKN